MLQRNEKDNLLKINCGGLVVLDGKESSSCIPYTTSLGEDIAFSFIVDRDGVITHTGIANAPTNEQVKEIFSGLNLSAPGVHITIHLTGGNGFENSINAEHAMLHTLNEIDNNRGIMAITSDCTADSAPNYCTLGILFDQHMAQYGSLSFAN